MFTSRAEYRILLRQDDADSRLTPIGAKIGLATERQMQILHTKEANIEAIISAMRATTLKADDANPLLESVGSAPVRQSVKAADLILRPGVNMTLLASAMPMLGEQNREALEAAEIRMKYAGYIDRERQLAQRMGQLDHVTLAGKIDYSTVTALSTEARQKLMAQQPETVGQASRIPGVSPADVNVLLLLLGR
jgi:tRNA uridine 5-carboxymethylaminomethyl modification enzyme